MPGDRCEANATRDSTMCVQHNKVESQRAKAILRRSANARLRDFVELEPEDSELLDPFSLLLWETRRSINKIKFYDDQLLGLSSEKELWWGLVKEEQINATEFAGTNKTYEARQNQILNMQDAERKRLFELFKLWTDTKLEAARIATVGVFKVEANKLIRAVLTEFGIDLVDPENRQRIANVLITQAEHLVGALEPPRELKGTLDL